MATDFVKEEGVMNKASNANKEKKEGPVARAIETQTAKLPSDLFLWTSIGAMATSLTLKLAGKDHIALFIGQCGRTILVTRDL